MVVGQGVDRIRSNQWVHDRLGITWHEWRSGGRGLEMHRSC